MSAIQVRGYTILTALKYVDTAISAGERERVLKALGMQRYETLKSRKPIEWCASSELSSVFDGIAQLADGDTEKALDRFIELGRFVGTEATNTFLRLVMRVMTPRLYASRLPSLFERDHTGGARLIVDRADDGEIVCSMKGVKGFDHVVAVGVGWVQFGLEAMGKKILERKCEGWTLQTPGPEEALITVRWSD